MGLRAEAAGRILPVGGIAGTEVPDCTSDRQGTDLRGIW
jgi:hypothetical protein